jgi:hypothetical protein
VLAALATAALDSDDTLAFWLLSLEARGGARDALPGAVDSERLKFILAPDERLKEYTRFTAAEIEELTTECGWYCDPDKSPSSDYKFNITLRHVLHTSTLLRLFRNSTAAMIIFNVMKHYVVQAYPFFSYCGYHDVMRMMLSLLQVGDLSENLQ